MTNIKEIFRFCVSGALLVAVDVGIYSLLIHFLPPWFSKAISFTLGGVLAYLINKYWTFAQQKQSAVEIVRFILGNGSALVLNVITNELILRASKDAVWLAVACATALTAVYTYFVFKFWVFKT